MWAPVRRGSMRLCLWGALAVIVASPALGQTNPAALGADTALGGSFVTGVDDLPLMAGLSEDVGSTVHFDKPSGRIVEALASGLVSREKVAAFYGETLPELGWTSVGGLAFVREGESLRISISDVSGAVNVRFSLSPE